MIENEMETAIQGLGCMVLELQGPGTQRGCRYHKPFKLMLVFRT